MGSDNLQLPHITSNFPLVAIVIMVATVMVMLVMVVVVNMVVMVVRQDRTGRDTVRDKVTFKLAIFI